MATGKIKNIIYMDKTLSASAGSHITLRTTPIIGRYGQVVSLSIYFDATATISNNSHIVNFSSNLPLPVS